MARSIAIFRSRVSRSSGRTRAWTIPPRELPTATGLVRQMTLIRAKIVMTDAVRGPVVVHRDLSFRVFAVDAVQDRAQMHDESQREPSGARRSRSAAHRAGLKALANCVDRPEAIAPPPPPRPSFKPPHRWSRWNVPAVVSTN